ETIYGRQRLEAARLANQVKARAVSEIKELQETDLCLVAVSDGAIAELAESLSFEHSLVVHHAGSVPIQVLAPCSPNRGVLWPILSIHKSNPPTIRSFPIAWEASNPASAQILLDLIDDLGARAWELYSPQRSALHLAAVMGNNFVAHLLSETRAYCKEKDLPFALLKPLVEMTIEQAFSDSDPGSLLTGPARRGDQRILESHQKMLA